LSRAHRKLLIDVAGGVASTLLNVARMHRLALGVLVAVSVVGTARADGFYFTESIGGTHVKDELGAYMSGAVRVHVGLGMRRQNLALELWAGGDMNMATQDQYTGDPPMDLFEYGLDLKYLQPLSRHFEVYLRGSASVGQMEGGALDGYRGRGLGMGAGIQIKGKVSAWGLLFWPLFFIPSLPGPKLTGALYLDDGYDFYRLHGDAPVAVDAQLTHITFGYALGTDF
jgi:hypothetical protein